MAETVWNPKTHRYVLKKNAHKYGIITDEFVMPTNNMHTIRPILTWENENELDYENKDFDTLRDEVKESFKTFCLENVAITEPVKYVFVGSGYADRVIKNIRSLKNIKKDRAVVIFPDLHWEAQMKPLIVGDISDGKHVLNICSMLPEYYLKSGGIIFKRFKKRHGDELDFVDKVGDLKFCGFCDVLSSICVSWYKIESDTFMYIAVDTESG